MKTIEEKIEAKAREYGIGEGYDGKIEPGSQMGFEEGAKWMYEELTRWRGPEEDMCTLENEGKFILIKYRLIDEFHLIGNAFYNQTVYIKDRIARLPDGEYLRNNPVIDLYGWRLV